MLCYCKLPRVAFLLQPKSCGLGGFHLQIPRLPHQHSINTIDTDHLDSEKDALSVHVEEGCQKKRGIMPLLAKNDFTWKFVRGPISDVSICCNRT